jgi:hypothetical protein
MRRFSSPYAAHLPAIRTLAASMAPRVSSTAPVGFIRPAVDGALSVPAEVLARGGQRAGRGAGSNVPRTQSKPDYGITTGRVAGLPVLMQVG